MMCPKHHSIKRRSRWLAFASLVLVVALGVFALFFHTLVRSQAYTVSYGVGPVAYTDGSLFRPWDLRIAVRALRGRLFCVHVPQWEPPWGPWLIVDFDKQMYFLPGANPEISGMNEYLGVALPDGKIGVGWKVEFSDGRALCYAPTGEWCLLTPVP